MAGARVRRELPFPQGVNHKTIVAKQEEILTLWSKGITLIPADEIPYYTGLPKKLPIPIFCQVYVTNPSSSEEEDSEFILPNPSSDSLILSWGSDRAHPSTHSRDVVLAESICDGQGPGGVSQRRTLRQFTLPHIGETVLAASFPAINMHVGQNLNDGLDSNALVMNLQSDGDEIQGGHPNSTLTVFLTYILVNLTA